MNRIFDALSVLIFGLDQVAPQCNCTTDAAFEAEAALVLLAEEIEAGAEQLCRDDAGWSL